MSRRMTHSLMAGRLGRELRWGTMGASLWSDPIVVPQRQISSGSSGTALSTTRRSLQSEPLREEGKKEIDQKEKTGKAMPTPRRRRHAAVALAIIAAGLVQGELVREIYPVRALARIPFPCLEVAAAVASANFGLSALACANSQTSMRADEARNIVVLGEEFGQYDYVCRYARISPSIVPELVGQVDVSGSLARRELDALVRSDALTGGMHTGHSRVIDSLAVPGWTVAVSCV